ncbi:MAG: lipid-binding SYLF domain-containing protein [Acidobacteria bacterium]|nr:lipid-binding SYLF domain-containing protein [Acidobacteriota bacterium]
MSRSKLQVKRVATLTALLALFQLSTRADDKSKVSDRVVSSAAVLKEIMGMPEKGIPQELLDKSACVAVIPSMKKGGFIFGGNYGRGALSCRTQSGQGPWSPPSMLLLGGGSFGLQIGAQAVDLVLLIMNLRGLESLLDSKFTLGGDASVAAGPVGRTAAAETDAWMSAQILAYSRARGLFAGLIVKGGVLRPDKDANELLYGRPVRAATLVLGGASDKVTPVPQFSKDVQIFLDELNRISPSKKK